VRPDAKLISEREGYRGEQAGEEEGKASTVKDQEPPLLDYTKARPGPSATAILVGTASIACSLLIGFVGITTTMLGVGCAYLWATGAKPVDKSVLSVASDAGIMVICGTVLTVLAIRLLRESLRVGPNSTPHS
jgi:hypothetical protein